MTEPRLTTMFEDMSLPLGAVQGMSPLDVASIVPSHRGSGYVTASSCGSLDVIYRFVLILEAALHNHAARISEGHICI